VYERLDMERLDLREFVNVVIGAPVGKAAGGVEIGSSGMGVVDLGCWGATLQNVCDYLFLR
jgi:hypothetical protein